MTHVHPVATFLYHLYDMESEFRFHDTAHALRIGKGKCHVSELRHQLALTHKSEFTALFGAFNIFGIHPCKHRESGRSGVDTVGKFAKTVFHAVNLLTRNGRRDADYLHFDLSGYHDYAVSGQGVIVLAYFCGSGFDVAYKFLLHLLDNHLVAYHFRHILADI